MRFIHNVGVLLSIIVVLFVATYDLKGQNSYWEYILEDIETDEELLEVFKTDNGIIVIGRYNFFKLDSLGNMEWHKKNIVTDLDFYLTSAKFYKKEGDDFVILGGGTEFNNNYELVYLKVKDNGIINKVPVSSFNKPFNKYILHDVQILNDSIILTSNTHKNTEHLKVCKINLATEDTVWKYLQTDKVRSAKISTDSLENVLISGRTDQSSFYVLKVDKEGTKIWGNVYHSFNQNNSILRVSHHSLFCVNDFYCVFNIYLQDFSFQKLNHLGLPVQQNTSLPIEYTNYTSPNIMIDNKNNIWAAAFLKQKRLILRKYDIHGNQIKEYCFPIYNRNSVVKPIKLIFDNNNSFYIIANQQNYLSNHFFYIAKLDSLVSTQKPYLLNGTLSTQFKNNPVEGVLFKNETDNTYCFTDENGYFVFPALSGTYNFRYFNPSPNTGLLKHTGIKQSAWVGKYNKTLINNKVPYPVDEKSFAISMYATPLKPCDTITYYITLKELSYVNYLSETETSLKLDLTLPLGILPLSKSLKQQDASTYRIELPILEKDTSFQVKAIASCSLPSGHTLCSNIEVYPLKSTDWSQFNPKVKGNCLHHSIHFNAVSSDENMLYIDDALTKIFYKNGIDESDYFLDAIKGKTYRIVSVLNNIHTYNEERYISPIAQSVISSCAIDYTDTTPIDYANSMQLNFPQFIMSNYTICQPVVPQNSIINKLIAQPVGITDQHYIPDTAYIHYTIRFEALDKSQTPAKLTIVDTLDTEHLDLHSIIIGPKSHPFGLTVSGENNTLVWKANINETNKTTWKNPGFVSFYIQPKKDLAKNTIIQNRASIQFNEENPIRTETIFHTLNDTILKEDYQKDITTQPSFSETPFAFPNPASKGSFTVFLPEKYDQSYFQLYNINGQLMSQKHITYYYNHIYISGLSPGIYFYQIFDRKVFTGKVIVQ